MHTQYSIEPASEVEDRVTLEIYEGWLRRPVSTDTASNSSKEVWQNIGPPVYAVRFQTCHNRTHTHIHSYCFTYTLLTLTVLFSVLRCS